MTSHDHWNSKVKLVGDSISMIEYDWNQFLTFRVKVVSKRSIGAKLLNLSVSDASVFKAWLCLACFRAPFQVLGNIVVSHNFAFDLNLVTRIENEDVTVTRSVDSLEPNLISTSKLQV